MKAKDKNVNTAKKSPIDKVFTRDFRNALRVCDINISEQLADNIIDVMELLIEKGGQATLMDLEKVKDNFYQNS